MSIKTTTTLAATPSLHSRLDKNGLSAERCMLVNLQLRAKEISMQENIKTQKSVGMIDLFANLKEKESSG